MGKTVEEEIRNGEHPNPVNNPQPSSVRILITVTKGFYEDYLLDMSMSHSTGYRDINSWSSLKKR